MSLHVSDHKMSRNGYLIMRSSSDLMRWRIAGFQTWSSQIAFWRQLLQSLVPCQLVELVLGSFCSAKQDIFKRCLPAFVLRCVPGCHYINMNQLRDQDQGLACSENTFVLLFISVAVSSPDQLGKEGKCGISQNKAVLPCYKSRQLCVQKQGK